MRRGRSTSRAPSSKAPPCGIKVSATAPSSAHSAASSTRRSAARARRRRARSRARVPARRRARPPRAASGAGTRDATTRGSPWGADLSGGIAARVSAARCAVFASGVLLRRAAEEIRDFEVDAGVALESAAPPLLRPETLGSTGGASGRHVAQPASPSSASAATPRPIPRRPHSLRIFSRWFATRLVALRVSSTRCDFSTTRS